MINESRAKYHFCQLFSVLIFILVLFQFSSVQSLSCVRLFADPWTAACQASLSITNTRSSLSLTSIESVMASSHLILCRPLLLLPPIPPSIKVFSNVQRCNLKIIIWALNTYARYYNKNFIYLTSSNLQKVSVRCNNGIPTTQL